MTFQIIIQNRLQTEEAVATQAQADVVCAVMNRMHRPPVHLFPFECLKEIEARCVDQPFPHDLRIDSLGAQIEDLVAFAPKDWPLNVWSWLGAWTQGNHHLYSIIRPWFDTEEHYAFDTQTSPEDQANFLLLVAHASADIGYEEPDAS